MSLFRKAIRPANSVTPKDIVSHGGSAFMTWTMAGLSGYSHAPLAESRGSNTYLGKWPLFYLNTPFNFEARLAVKRGNKKPGRAVLDRVFIPYCLDVFAQSLPGKPTISKKPATPLRRDLFDSAGLNPVRRYVRSRTSSGGGQQAPRKAQHLLQPPGRRAA